MAFGWSIFNPSISHTHSLFVFKNLHAVFVDYVSFSHTYSVLEMRVVIEHLLLISNKHV